MDMIFYAYQWPLTSGSNIKKMAQLWKTFMQSNTEKMFLLMRCRFLKEFSFLSKDQNETDRGESSRKASRPCWSGVLPFFDWSRLKLAFRRTVLPLCPILPWLHNLMRWSTKPSRGKSKDRPHSDFRSTRNRWSPDSKKRSCYVATIPWRWLIKSSCRTLSMCISGKKSRIWLSTHKRSRWSATARGPLLA